MRRGAPSECGHFELDLGRPAFSLCYNTTAVGRAAHAVRWTKVHPAAFFVGMHLLYLDDSGSAGNQDEKYFVLGGLSVFEAQAHWFSEQLDSLAESIDPGSPSNVEFHASEVFSRRSSPWKGMSKEEAQGVIKAVLRIVAESYDTARVFACAVHKPSFQGDDPVELAFEDLCSRFDQYLSRLRSQGSRHRGLLILDKTTHETSLQQLAREFRRLGTQWGSIKNLADIPFFVDSKASRLIQVADHIAYAVFRRFNASDTQYFDIIAPKFDSSQGVIHGLAHKISDGANCVCPACLSRRLSRAT